MWPRHEPGEGWIMKYLRLGSSGLMVSELCLGTMTFGEEMGIGSPASECREIFDAFMAAGGNFLDTANIYNRGTSERILGELIASHRDYVVVASKYSLNTRADDPNAGGNHRKNLVQSLDASLERLGTSYLDLFWIHGWDVSASLPAVMRALDDQVRAGKILHVGISNAPAWVIAAANTLAQERNLTPFTAMQLHYNLVERGIEPEFLELAAAQDMAITPWSPLAGGLLTGKYAGSADPAARAGARLETSPMGARTLTDEKRSVAEQLAVVAAEIGCSSAQLALAWLRQRSAAPTIPIIGARHLGQLQDNLGAVELELSTDQLQRLDDLAPPPARYPANLLGSEFFQRMMFGEPRAAGNRIPQE
jgi:aryl-alcohol dehydrogenase-like predicted oxidoreductase